MVDLDAVLEEVNRIRETSFDMKPIPAIPKGRQHSGHACPLAIAFEASGLAEGVYRNEFGRYFVRRRKPGETPPFHDHIYDQVTLPDVLSAFIQEFDTGKIPELVTS